MGYEVKVLIGTVSRFDNQTPTWFSTVATYDLCKVDLFEMTEGINCSGAKLLARNELMEAPIPIYYYADDGNTKIFEDCYDKKLVAFESEILLEELKRQAKTNDYRRFPPLIAMLESLLAVWGKEKLYVVLFGH